MKTAGFSDIFISHATEDEGIAKAWHELLRGISQGKVRAWYSEYTDPEGGVAGVVAGDDWRKTLTQALEYAKTILVVLTPASSERPWVHYEVGFASGQKKRIIPLLHFMDRKGVNELFKTIMPQAVLSRNKAEVYKMIQDVLFPGEQVTKLATKAWDLYYKKFDKALQDQAIAAATRRLFRDHFHNGAIAKQLYGTWSAQWIQVHDDGREEPFEKDAVYVWTTEFRIRMIGVSQKQGIDQFRSREFKFYPMEGIVSNQFWIALSYWSPGSFPVCGTCLLKCKGVNWRHLIGTWQGFTARSIEDEPAFTNGKVEMVKLDDKLTPIYEVEERLKIDSAGS